jgi:hypothetical protein
MKYLKMIGLAAVAAMAMMAFTAGSASATTLEVKHVIQNGPVKLVASLQAGTSAILKTTAGGSENTCTISNVEGTTSTYTGASVSGGLSSLTFGGPCTNPVTVHKAGSLSVSHIAGSDDGTVTSANAEVTSYSAAIGAYVNCKTGTGTHLGTLTGSTLGHATLDVNAVLNCGFFLPSAKWEGTYTVTSPTGLQVTS